MREEIGDFGEVRQARPAARFDRTASSLRLPAPQLGEHTLEILEALGYDEPSRNRLLAEGVVSSVEK